MKMRLLACFLVVMLLCMYICASAQAAVLNLPESLRAIEKEVFQGATSIDQVVVPDGMVSIDSRAFANSSLREINLPGSLNYIADDAFEGCASNLMLLPEYGSYAQQWCEDSGLLYQTTGLGQSAPENLHSIYSVEYDETAETRGFFVKLSTVEECILVLEILDDSGTNRLDRVTENVQGGLSGAEIRLLYTKTMPQHYQLKAWLENASGEALCDPYINIHHTQAYEEFMNQTAADYPAEKVIDYGDSGYVVLADNVKKLGVKATTNADGSYTFKTGADLKAGDVIVVSVDGVQTPMKIGSITKDAAGTVTVVESDDVALEELFNVVNISTSCGGRGGESEGLEIPINVPSTSIGTGDVKINFSAEGMIVIDANFFYSSHIFQLETPYIEFDVSISSDIDAKVGVRGAIDSFKNNISPKIELSVCKLFEALPVDCPMTLALAVNAVAADGVEAAVTIDVTSCTGYSSLTGLYSESTGDSDFDVIPKSTAEIYIGPELSLDLDIKNVFTARIGVHAGAYCKLADPYVLATEDIDGLDAYHACQLCYSGDTGLYCWPRGTVYAKLMTGVSTTPVNEGEPQYWELEKAYASVVNDEESPFEGKVHMDTGECPNWKYRTDIYTQNLEGEMEDGLPVTITGGRLKAREYGASPYSTYLYPGKYKASTIFSSTGAAADFAILDFARVIFIEEEGATINGVVLHNVTKEPISGAHISLTSENGKTYETTSGADGRYLIERVREGTYNYYITKPGFQDVEVRKLKYTAGTYASDKMYMVPLGVPFLKTGYIDADSARVQALTEKGDYPEGLPKIFVTVDDKVGVGYKKVTIEHEYCEKPYTFTNTNALGVDFYAVDMGDGTYTMVVSFFPSGTGAGKYNYILREINGELELVRNLKYNGYPDNIRVSATFTSGREYSGTILPTGHAFSGVMKDSNNYRKNTSLRSYDLGYVDLELREDGFYNLIFRTMEYGVGYFDPVGSSYTRFILNGGELTIDTQWYESDYSTVTNH